MSESNLRIVFNKFDKEHKNTLDCAEFNEFLKSYKKEPISEDEFDKVCAEVDVDHQKHTLNFEEVKKVLNHITAEPKFNEDKVTNNTK
jgi:Ca2+-binding EF-hand superfamily protein|tara:strand:+ start:378 stop:641 length:264 start_codon:yes stop_codon:yes gene_type:complete